MAYCKAVEPEILVKINISMSVYGSFPGWTKRIFVSPKHILRIMIGYVYVNGGRVFKSLIHLCLPQKFQSMKKKNRSAVHGH